MANGGTEGIPVPAEPKTEVPAKPAEKGSISQQDAEAIAEAASKELGGLVESIQKMALVVQKLEGGDEAVNGILQAGEQLIGMIAQSLGLEGPSPDEGQDESQGPVPMESGGRGKPV